MKNRKQSTRNQAHKARKSLTVDTPGFDAENMELEMSREEKLRATALLLASRYYVETICQDGQLYTAMVTSGQTLSPATSNALVAIACQFEHYLREGAVKFVRQDGKDVALVDPGQGAPEDSGKPVAAE